MSSAAAAPRYLQLVRLVPPASVSVEVVGEDSQKSPDVRLQVPPGNLLQGDEGGHRVALDLHLGLGEDVQVVGVQVGALVSSADAEAHAPLGQLPADPFLGCRERDLNSVLPKLGTRRNFCGGSTGCRRGPYPQGGPWDLQEVRDVKTSNFL